jgi:hypothetical protein
MDPTTAAGDGTVVTYAEDITWQPVGPLDADGRGIFVSLLYGDLETLGY